MRDLTDVEYCARFGDSVVAVQTDDRFGVASGVVVSADLVATGLTPIADCENLSILAPDNARLAVSSIGRDNPTSLAILRSDHARLKPAAMTAREICLGDRAVCIGRGSEGLKIFSGAVIIVGGPWRTIAGGAFDRLVRIEIEPNSINIGGLVLVGGEPVGIFVRGRAGFKPFLFPFNTLERIQAEFVAQDKVRLSLTAREVEVLRLLVTGASNKEIARALSLTDRTVKFHMNSLMRKLDADSRTDVVVRAMRLRIVDA